MQVREGTYEAVGAPYPKPRVERLRWISGRFWMRLFWGEGVFSTRLSRIRLGAHSQDGVRVKDDLGGRGDSPRGVTKSWREPGIPLYRFKTRH